MFPREVESVESSEMTLHHSQMAVETCGGTTGSGSDDINVARRAQMSGVRSVCIDT